MHPLRFPYSGIKAKVFVRKIGFKLRVMRLNHVESFNAFAARTARRRGWLQGAAGCDQGPLQGGSWSRPTPLQGRLPAVTRNAVACAGATATVVAQ
ncbi:hypothetical protein GW17_00062301 [Ensete ventricosum]|nr:hypothetical protein GW17_00062301 [Ensete ventricosum]